MKNLQFLICISVLNVLCICTSLAQSTQTCYSDLQCLGICSGPRDTTWVCKGDTIRFGGSDSAFDCAYGGHTSITIGSRSLTSYTVDRNGTYTCTGSASPRITGPNITRQVTYTVPNAGGSCPENYAYIIKAEAVINESGWYSLEWEHTISTWNEGTGSYDVTIKKVYSSAYFAVKGGGAVPSFTVSKKKANVGEAITITPSVNYTYPNSRANRFLLTTITTYCGITDSFTETNSNINPLTPFIYQSSRSKVNLYAGAIDNGCPTVKSGTQEVIFKPCGRESFGFFDAVLEAQVLEVERKTCAANSQDRQDYHFYDTTRTLCNSSQQCSINNIWNLYKSKISNQAPTADDFTSDTKMIASSIFAPPYNPNSPIYSGTKIDLFAPEAIAFKTGVYAFSRTNPFTRIAYRAVETLLPKPYSNPIVLHIDESNKCITNYTLPGHSLYPGKVTRCIVQECGQIKVKTFGEGITNVGDNLLGRAFANINYYAGRGLFSNVDDRFAALVNQTYPQRVVQDLTTETLTDLGIENKNWIVRGFRIKHPNNDEVTLFVRGDTGIFKVMNDVKMNFSTNGTYLGINVKNQAANGTWSTDGNTAITIDGANAQISSITADSFVVKGKMKSYVDTVLVDADYTMVFQKTPCSVTALLNPRITNISTTQVRVNWTSVGSGVNYLVEYKPSTSSAWIALPLTTGGQNFLSGLTLSTTYNVRVIADCGAGSFETINFTMPSPCNVPNAPLISNITATTARLDWSASGSGSYTVEYGLLNGSLNYYTTNGTFSSITGLTPSTTYKVRIRALCNDNPSNYSTFTTGSGGSRPFPVGLPTCLQDDFIELEKLYDASNGNSWTNKTNWFTSPNMATWYGITLTSNGCDVATISLNANNMVGSLYNLNLPNVYYISMNNNKLSGAIPNFNLPNLTQLRLYSNQLSGTIPNFNLPNLTHLGLDANQLIGNVPNFNMPLLRTLDARSNQLTGSIPNFNMPLLTQLALNDNALTGNIPNFNLPNLIYLVLSTNQLTGSIPNFNMPNLQGLSLYTNQLIGSIPNFNMPKLSTLYLSSNQLTGSIPNFNFPLLKYLSLNNNKLTGGAPDFNFPFLESIDISDNPNLGGNIPSLASSTNLQTYYAVRSGLTGSIPNFSQANLKTLWLFGNQLTGSIPNFNLPNLTELRLNLNQLTGSIPNLSNTPSLVVFFAAANQLTGNIPNFSNKLNLRSISLSGNQLSGNIPDFNLPSLSILYLRDNQLSGNIPSFSNTNLNAAPPTYTSIWLQGNKFIFGNIEGKSWLNTTDVRYEPQARIPIVFNGTNLSVNTGSANNVQLFSWYKDDALIATNQSNTYTLTAAGRYYCKISHNTLTTTSDTSRNLILQSEDYSFNPPCAKVAAAPAVASITGTSASITWAAATSAKDYNIEYKAAAASTWQVQKGIKSPYVLTGLTAGTNYLVRVVTNCINGGISDPSVEKAFTTLPPCNPPATTISNIGYTTARINWSALTGISGYEVRYKVKGAANWLTPTKTALATATFVDLTNLVLGTTYEYQIRLKCTATNSSEYSPTREFTTQTCTAPAAPTASQLTLTSARIDWAGVVGSLGYELRYRAKGATSWIPKTATATTTFINLTNLLPGTTYEYELRLKCTATGFSSFSATKEFMTVSCGVPNPVASDMTLSTARVSWTAIGGGLGYELRYRAKGATTWTSKTATATTTFINLTNLLPGTTYEYELRLKCTSTGFSSFSATKEFKTVSCGVPTPSALQTSYATARIGWSAIGGALGYELRYRVKGVTTWTPKTATATATFIDLTALKINTVYEYEMRLKCTSTGFSAYTATREFSTNSCLPVTPSVRSMTAISIVVGWTPQTGVSGYEVSYRKKGATTWIAKPVTGAATSSFNITALTKSTTYEIRMLTKCLTTNGSSAYSNIIEVTTPAQTGADESALQMPKPLVNKVFKENRMTISPNPTNGIVTLQINNAERGIGQIIVSDYLGKIILNLHNVSLDKGEQTQAIDLSNWSNGVYIIQITRGDWQESKKVLLHK